MTELLVYQRIRDLIETEKLGLTPYDPSLVQPNSLDVRLGNTESRYITTGYKNYINPADEAPRSVSRQIDDFIIVKPGEFVLVETMEYFKLPRDIVGFVLGKSSTGRLGVDTENAGLIDSGFEGTITLELYNKTQNYTYKLPVGFPIAQVVFYTCEEVEVSYGEKTTSRYQGQRGATPFRVQSHDTNDRTASDEANGETTTLGTIIDHFSPRKRRKGSSGNSGRSTDSGE